MNRTPQQQAFVDFLLAGSGHVALVARAGCGKTTTILQGVAVYAARHPDHEVVICCFGKAIQREIEEKLKKLGDFDWRKVQASTTHSMGWNLLRFAFRNVRIDDNKVRDLIRLHNEPVYGEFLDRKSVV